LRNGAGYVVDFPDLNDLNIFLRAAAQMRRKLLLKKWRAGVK